MVIMQHREPFTMLVGAGEAVPYYLSFISPDVLGVCIAVICSYYRDLFD